MSDSKITVKCVQFTLDYISILKRNLLVEVDGFGRSSFAPKFIDNARVAKLKNDLSDLWSDQENARESVRNQDGAFLQSVGYGLAEDFDLFLKVGYLLGDRVVLWDYIYGRMLKNKKIDDVDHYELCRVAENIIWAEDLANQGSLVILPQPFEWHKPSRDAFVKIAQSQPVTPSILGLVTTHAVAFDLNVHPYTIATSTSSYRNILDKHKQFYDESRKIEDKYLYETLLSGLLSTRLLSDIRFEEALGKPLSEFHSVVANRKEFYQEFKKKLSEGGSLESEQNLKLLSESLEKEILSVSAKAKDAVDEFAKNGAVVGGVLGLLSAFGDPSYAIPSAALSLVTAVGSLLTVNNSKKNIVTTVFSKLLK